MNLPPIGQQYTEKFAKLQELQRAQLEESREHMQILRGMPADTYATHYLALRAELDAKYGPAIAAQTALVNSLRKQLLEDLHAAV